MTTVTYRDGTMAADKLCSSYGIRREVAKMGYIEAGEFPSTPGTLIGGSGNMMDLAAFMAWYPFRDERELKFRHYRGADDAPEFIALVVTNDKIELWTEHCQPIDFSHEPFMAVGSGAKAAMAAMYMGASAIEAVRIASKVDIDTGDEVVSHTLRDI